MLLPAIRAKIGDWTYYVTTLTFEQVSMHIEKIDDQLHKSKGLKDLIQRSITKNLDDITEYILNQNELFFNSLVLAVYNGIPKWIEVELNYLDQDFFNMGFLEFPFEQKIFPVDGQHRVEGIKVAITKNPELKNNKIGAIFISHEKSDKGIQRSRRLFTTLNRYAKPVTMDDIIALDEDDSVAIITRNLLEEYDLFKDEKVIKSKNKAIPDSDKRSFTSIITLYQCNKELLKMYRAKRKYEEPNDERDKKSLNEYLKFRPKEIEIELFEKYCISYWNDFKDNIPQISEYLNNYKTSPNPALPYRNSETGGILLFRPVGLLPFIQASIEIHKRNNKSFGLIIQKLSEMVYEINRKPWVKILWNSHEKTMIMGNPGIVKLLLLYKYGNVIKESEKIGLSKAYADKTVADGAIIDNILDQI